MRRRSLLLGSCLLALAGCGGDDTKPSGVALTYKPASFATEALDRDVTIVRRRLAAFGVADATVRRAGGNIRVTVPAGERAAVMSAGVTAPGRLRFYDWEPNVVGPHGRPAPRDLAVTGGPSAGLAGIGLRAAAARAGKGRVIVRAEKHGWFVLQDRPALTWFDIADPKAARDVGAGGKGQPIVTFDFTSHGRLAFLVLSRAIVRRGRALGNPALNMQHFAIVLDDRLISVPFIDYHQNPHGVDARNGSQIEGEFTATSARRLAAILRSGPLAASLRLARVRPVRLP